MSDNRTTVNVHVWEDMDIEVHSTQGVVWVNMAEVAFFPNNGETVRELLVELKTWGEEIIRQADSLLGGGTIQELAE